MSDFINGQGHKARVKLANARKDDWAERAEVRRIRMAAAMAAEEANRASAAAQAVQDAETTCSCPICAGTGSVTVTRAAAAVEAWGQYHFHGYAPSKGVLASYAQMARGETVPASATVVNFLYGTTPPITAASSPGRPVAPETVEPPKVVKPARNAMPVEPVTDDGFLVEL